MCLLAFEQLKIVYTAINTLYLILVWPKHPIRIITAPYGAKQLFFTVKND